MSGTPGGIRISGTMTPAFETILTPEAVSFVAGLERSFRDRRHELLARRVRRQKELDAGKLPDFLPETRAVREGDWRIDPVPGDLRDRRVEITGPVDRKMVINALNSGASVFMADFEDSHSPTWANCMDGQANLVDAVRGTIAYEDPETGRRYRLAEKLAVMMVRPRGWHLVERHVEV